MMNNLRAASFLGLLACLISFGQSQHVSGVIAELDTRTQTLRVATEDGSVVTVIWDKGTVFSQRSDEGVVSISGSDLERGARVLVFGFPERGTLKAVGVQMAETAKNKADRAAIRSIQKPNESRKGLVATLEARVDLARATPQQIAEAFWQTALNKCKRPEESSPSEFWSETKVKFFKGSRLFRDPVPDQTQIDWTLAEYQAPFQYPLEVETPTEAQRRNSGRVWQAHSRFESKVYRARKLYLVISGGTVQRAGSYKTEWSAWEDYIGGQRGVAALLALAGGALDLVFYKDAEGVHFVQYPGIEADYNSWEPTSCDVLTAHDPFPDYDVSVRKFAPNN
jgi:hypothetical protein